MAELDVGRPQACHNLADIASPSHLRLLQPAVQSVEKQRGDESSADGEQLEDALRHLHRASRPETLDELRLVLQRQLVTSARACGLDNAHRDSGCCKIGLVNVAAAQARHERDDVRVLVHCGGE